MSNSISYALGVAVGFNFAIIILGIIAIILANKKVAPWILYIIGLAITAIAHAGSYFGGALNYLALALSVIFAIFFLVIIIKRKNNARRKAKALEALAKEKAAQASTTQN